MSLEELEYERQRNEQKLLELEEMYQRKKEMGTGAGRSRANMSGFSGRGSARSVTHEKKKSVQINEVPMEHVRQVSQERGRSSRQNSGDRSYRENSFRKSRSAKRSHSKKSKKSQEARVSPRRQLYEAKFDNYKSNRELKDVKNTKREALKKEDFDKYTKNENSPSKQTYRYSQKKGKAKSTVYTEDDEKLLISPEKVHEERKQRELSKRQAGQVDEFQKLGVATEDKTLYFLLKWIFNAIKIETDEDDMVLKGHSYVRKIDLVKQL